MYSGNRWLTIEEMCVNARYIADYLLFRGWTLNAISVMLGNMQTESTINPSIWEDFDEGNLDGGFGLVQWTPASGYINWCNTVGLISTEMNSNIQRILYEVTNNIQWMHPAMTFEQFTHSTYTAYNLGVLFLNHYERPLTPDPVTRGTQAQEWFSYLSTYAPRQKRKYKQFLFLRKRRVII
jgi:hypothetical protein